MDNTLYYGDNLKVLREHIKDESVDLIYLDPPFNSKADYNILFKETTGELSKAQITAFEDTWHWTEEAERALQEIVDTAPPNVVEMMRSFLQFVGRNDMMAYLTMMCIRLIELRRVLKPTGSIYLHCDPTASHYLKILMDTIFGKKNFRNEIIWKRSSSHSGAKRWGPIHDIILFYTKEKDFVWNKVYGSYDEGYLARFYRHEDAGGRYRIGDLTGAGVRMGESGQPWRECNPTKAGRHWAVPLEILNQIASAKDLKRMTVQQKLDTLEKHGLIYWPPRGKVPQLKRYLRMDKGNPVQDIISDIGPISAHAAERLGYPTQKPEALLERIIRASSNEGDVVLDPFCGCGTTISAAQKLNRQWVGIDITHLAINLIKLRLKDMFGLEAPKGYKVVGEPEDLSAAQELAKYDRFQFQWWACSLIEARPYGDKKRGADTGIDGLMFFMDGKEDVKKVIVSVKSGNVSVKDIRDLGHVIDREDAAIGVFVTLEPPTGPMAKEATAKGFYKSAITGRKYPRIQILTIKDILGGKKPAVPEHYALPGFKKAPAHEPEAKSERLDF